MPKILYIFFQFHSNFSSANFETISFETKFFFFFRFRFRFRFSKIILNNDDDDDNAYCLFVAVSAKAFSSFVFFNY